MTSIQREIYIYWNQIVTELIDAINDGVDEQILEQQMEVHWSQLMWMEKAKQRLCEEL